VLARVRVIMSSIAAPTSGSPWTAVLKSRESASQVFALEVHELCERQLWSGDITTVVAIALVVAA
jgi:hypothetical protein